MLDTALATDRPARNALITEHMDMARKMARKMSRRLPTSVCREDIESAALLGLTEAGSRYDDARGEPFMAFAAKRVRGAILDYLRKNDVLSRRARQGAKHVAEVARGLEAELGRGATEGEIAAAMGITEAELGERYGAAREATVIHLDDLRSELPDSSHHDVAERQCRKSALVKALTTLEERHALVLSLYYCEGLTLREIGAILEVTESRVCQLHTQALRQLKAVLA